ncbi:hypothetical protein [Thaumasiovibrio subtropicus]|uniref:hypothetical protein n=1 Tax=Thaumasiovibrio subtropicus TaxID=1891207 RepID=UPI000B3522EA|nr:hypothetical protein [Thaumasiovibrio subtropicus]
MKIALRWGMNLEVFFFNYHFKWGLGDTLTENEGSVLPPLSAHLERDLGIHRKRDDARDYTKYL